MGLFSSLFSKHEEEEPRVSAGREDYRMTMELPALLYRLREDGSGSPESCHIIDISAGGAGVQTRRRFPEGAASRIEFTIDGKDISLPCRIVRVSVKGPGEFICGVAFDREDEARIDALARSIFRLQQQTRRNSLYR